MGATPRDYFHTARDEQYLRLLREEEAFWDGRVETLLTKTARPGIQRYLNERLAGDPDRRWYETIGDYGTFRNGCVLGAGPGQVEEHLLSTQADLRLTIYDISGGALSRLQERLDRTFPGRAETRQEDLNFVSLPSETFDLVVANSSLHHIVNLEHLAYEVNRALTSEGRFFMEDTVSESYFQFAPEKKRLFELFRGATEEDAARGLRIDWPDRDRWEFSPFESVRSGDILDVFARYFHPELVRTSSALVALSIFVRPRALPPGPSGLLVRAWLRARRTAAALAARLLGRDREIARGFAKGGLLFALDSLVCDSDYLKPGAAFGVYRKRDDG